MDKKTLKKHFDKPESIDRSAPFWSWNGKLEVDEIKRQAHDMHLKGMGGFFMHSRVGLETEYMSKEWLDAINGACEQAKDDESLAWLYDEDRWPSGGAGGLVCNKNADYASKGFTIRINDKNFEGLLKRYVAIINEEQLIQLKSDCDVLKDNEVYLYLGYDTTLPMEWFNDTPGTDNINKEAVREFIDSTYEKYKEEVGQYFGNVIPGIFTDEPSIDSAIREYDRNDLARLPWTKELQSFFLENRGYDLYDLAPYLFFNGEFSKKVRHDYFRTIGEMFATNFTKQIYDWCDENKLQFTGHFLAENRVGSYILLSGSVMPNFMYEHIPGVDMLGEKCEEFMTVKKCTSVGNQMGRHRMLSETYGVSGWEFTFEGQKWVGDYQFVLGINMRCQHLAWYSMTGCRKRDYPPVFNYQTTWWEHNNLVEDYFARIASVTSKGKPVRDVLLLHPLSTIWTKMEFKRDDIQLSQKQAEMDECGYQLNDFTRFLLGQHYDLDYGDEDIISMIGSIENNRFVIGEASYKVVVIPKNTETLYKTTVTLLIEFMNNGGSIICYDNPPAYIETEENLLIETMIEHENMTLVADNKQLINTLDYIIGRNVSVIDKNDYESEQLLYMLRDHGEGHSLFIINNDRYKGYNTTVIVKGSKVEEWDLITGETKSVDYYNEDGSIYIDASFGPCDSKMYMISDDALDAVKEDHSKYQVLKYLGPDCEFTRCDPNVLVMDMCSYSFDNQPYSDVKEIFMHQENFRTDMNMTSIKQNRGVQRYKWMYEEHENNGKKLQLKYHFNCIDLPLNTELVIENSQYFKKITLNGKNVPINKTGWFMDIKFDKITVDGIIKGENELILECDYTHDMELENIYIIGDFAVNIKQEIISEPAKMHFGDWAMQGYLFYPGSMEYTFTYHHEQECEKILVDVPVFSAALMEVYINKEKADYIPWKAKSKVDVSKLVKKGDNEITIKLIGTPRNMFGPNHFANCDNKYHSSYTFSPDEFEYTSDYITHPYGLFEQVYILGK